MMAVLAVTTSSVHAPTALATNGNTLPRRRQEALCALPFLARGEIAYFSKYVDDEVRIDRSNLLVYKKAEPICPDGFDEYTSKDETEVVTVSTERVRFCEGEPRVQDGHGIFECDIAIINLER
ncbi:hypothetical protein PHYPSEUDO_010410 [Phytophthora pseudosyringae]|uniref:Uncharacterized protein n=1 Tax=Phytophthora pseudosyringae TaxID=221518 RepID=A0A8T1VB15_9STRA|nr:hypothetical protein PHYPSEUDO_010410 [Phytophthora pseudosyringae]